MKHQSRSTDATLRSAELRPDFRGNLFLGLLLGLHLLISLPQAAECAYAQKQTSNRVALQNQDGC